MRASSSAGKHRENIIMLNDASRGEREAEWGGGVCSAQREQQLRESGTVGVFGTDRGATV